MPHIENGAALIRGTGDFVCHMVRREGSAAVARLSAGKKKRAAAFAATRSAFFYWADGALKRTRRTAMRSAEPCPAVRMLTS